jgi:hypothetical protein
VRAALAERHRGEARCAVSAAAVRGRSSARSVLAAQTAAPPGAAVSTAAESTAARPLTAAARRPSTVLPTTVPLRKGLPYPNALSGKLLEAWSTATGHDRGGRPSEVVLRSVVIDHAIVAAIGTVVPITAREAAWCVSVAPCCVSVARGALPAGNTPHTSSALRALGSTPLLAAAWGHAGPWGAAPRSTAS